jgi:hypothetical protein
MIPAALEHIATTLRKIQQDLPALIGEVIEDNEREIAQMNVEQLQEGQRSDGSVLPNYSIASVQKFGKRPGPMTLENTGAFYRGIRVRASKTFAEIIGTDPKTGMLEARYDLTIIGLSEDNTERLKFEILVPGLIDKINAKYFP